MTTDLIRDFYNIKAKHLGCVITIGNFDGVHVGHKSLIEKLKKLSATLDTTSLVMTFEPQPLEYFNPDSCVPRLTRLREKFHHLAKTGVDAVLVSRFNSVFAKKSADMFLKEILVDRLKIKAILVGEDFRFGYKREGDIDLLKKMGERYGFLVNIMPNVMLHEERVSSTSIRKALLNADQGYAEQLLGRPFTMMGRIVYGSQLGRQLGFPTANIYLHRKATPIKGIYIVRLYGISEKGLPGVANVGVRPTIGGTRILLEVYLFNFNQNIYGKYVTVEFCKKLREEVRFANLELLKNQMVLDANDASNYFVERGEL